MTDFVIVAAAVAALAASEPAPGAVSPVPPGAPTIGFRLYADLAACERATSTLVAPAGTRLVCLPVEPLEGELASAY